MDQTKTETENYICNLCKASCKNPEALKKHKRRSRTLEVIIKLRDYDISLPFINGYFKCPLAGCKSKLSNIDTLSKHLSTQHSENITVILSKDEQGKKRSFGDDLENFDFATGAKRALHDHQNQKAHPLSAGLGCEPVALHLSHHNAKEDISVTGLFETNKVKLISNTLPFFNPTKSMPAQAVIQLHQEKNNPVEALPYIIAASTLKDVRLSKLPGLMDVYTYNRPDDNLINLLNYDFRLNSNVLYAVAKLHTGAIVYSENENYLLLTCEAYCRSKSVDIHAETSGKSIPSNKQSLFVGICEESDVHGLKTKLKIGVYHMNILCTMSASLGSILDINIGATTNIPATSQLSIVYPESNIMEFKVKIKAPVDYRIEPNINAG